MKLSSLLVSASMLAFTVTPAFATYMPSWNWDTGTTVNNSANISSSATSMSSTGMNTINAGSNNSMGHPFGLMAMFHMPSMSPAPVNTIVSGVASSNGNSQVGFVNNTGSLTNLKTVNNSAGISSMAKATSLTGKNIINGNGGTNLVMSGNAGSTSSSLVTNVNTTGFGM